MSECVRVRVGISVHPCVCVSVHVSVCGVCTFVHPCVHACVCLRGAVSGEAHGVRRRTGSQGRGGRPRAVPGWAACPWQAAGWP